MASIYATLLLLLLLLQVHLHNALLIKGSVSCLDCSHHYNLAGVKVAVKCDHEKEHTTTTTYESGHFEAKITTSSPPPPTSCLAKLLGGPTQLCSPKERLVSKVVKPVGSDHYTISTPLTFFSSCNNINVSKKKSEGSGLEFGSSKTVDVPLPPEWGLAPSSFYVNPFIPIIGIP